MTIEIRFGIQRGEFSLDVDTELPSVGISAIFGPSGCGKTTLLRAIAGLDFHPDGFLKIGEYTWQDGDRFLPPHRRPLGYVFQEASLLDHLSVRGNLEFGVKRIPEDKRRIALDEAIELLEIAPFLQRAPAELSGGEKQRVAIARALAVSPELLLMDEPLAALDSARKQEIIPYLESLHRQLDIPILYVSHQLGEVSRLADHVLMLQSGRVTATGGVHGMLTRLDLPSAHDDDAAAVIDAVVSGHDDRFELTFLDFPGGRITMTRLGYETGSPVRLRLAARDVSLTLQRQSGTSILNILPVTVDSLSHHKKAQVNARLLAGGVPLLARITRKSSEELNLQPGMQLFAQIKSIALIT